MSKKPTTAGADDEIERLKGIIDDLRHASAEKDKTIAKTADDVVGLKAELQSKDAEITTLRTESQSIVQQLGEARMKIEGLIRQGPPSTLDNLPSLGEAKVFPSMEQQDEAAKVEMGIAAPPVAVPRSG